MSISTNVLLFSLALLLSLSCKMGSEGPKPASVANLGSCITGRWHDSKLPIQLKISDSLFSDMAHYNASYSETSNPLNTMAIQWNAALENKKQLFSFPLGRTSDVTGASTLNHYYGDGVIGIYKSENWFSESSANALAVTYYHGFIAKNSRLGQYLEFTHADIVLNYKNFGDRLTYNSSAIFGYHVPTIVLHEIGHLIGFCHENDNNSVMAPSYSGVRNMLTTFDNLFASIVYETSLQTSSPSGVTKALSNRSKAATTQYEEGDLISGIIELRDDGKCVHSLNGEIIYEHQVDLHQQSSPIP